jgi:pimeloyl-ACP methyl ester carboxylesterase
MLGGQMAQAGGWLSRTQGVIGDDLDCSSAGYLLIPELIVALEANEPAVARDLAIRASEIAARFDDADLKALAELGRGQAQIALGENRASVALVELARGDISAAAAGISRALADTGPPTRRPVLLAAAVEIFMSELGVPRIPVADLTAITAQTSVVWGRHDRANRVRIAEAASERFGWPLHVIEEAADDPPMETPDEFVNAVLAS